MFSRGKAMFGSAIEMTPFGDSYKIGCKLFKSFINSY